MIKINTSDANFLEIIEDFNKSLIEINSFFIDTMPLNQDYPATTVEHCIFSFDWVCNSFFGRVTNLANNYCEAINKEETLVAAILGRALLESISHFHHLFYRISNYLKLKKYGRVNYILAQYMLGGDHGFEGDEKKIDKIHVNDSLRSMDETYKFVSKIHYWLCEFAHPNALGSCLMFSRLNKQDQKVRFYQKPVLQDSLSPALEAAILLPVFCDDWKNSSEIRLQIKKEWKPSADICNLFEKDR
jgi:hypothetical protein